MKKEVGWNLEVVAFDKPPFKLFTPRFSNKSVQAPSSKRPKTTRRTLFLSFEIYNCLEITACKFHGFFHKAPTLFRY